MKYTLEMFQEEHPELYAQIVESAKAEKETEMKESLEAEFAQKVAQAIEEKKDEFMTEAKKSVMESEDIVALKGIVEAVINAVKPMIPEAKTKEELDADLVAANEELKGQLESVQAENKTLKEDKAQAEKAIEEAETKKAVAEKVDALVEGHRFAGELKAKLAECKTVEEAEAMFKTEDEFIKKLTEGVEPPTGSGKVKAEDEKKALSESLARQKQLAGLK